MPRIAPAPDLLVVVLVDGPHAHRRVAGLTLAERARRVGGKVGAQVVERAQARTAHRPGAPVLVIRGFDQMVHTPLVEDLAASTASRAVAVSPDDGAPAGALLARGADADALVEAITRGDDDLALARAWLADGAAAIPHGAIARHAATTDAEVRGAEKLLYRILHKAQDNVITRYLFRPVSHAMTKVVVHTPITPNQVSIVVAILCAFGIWLTAQGPMSSALWGSVVILIATYIDCVDGEIARLKLLSSRFGAWFDTIVDELCSVGQVLALGWHCHLWFGPDYFGELPFDPWMAVFWISAVTYPLVIYCVYFNIIVVVGSANSQDYVHHFVVDGDRLRPKPVVERPRPKTWFGKFIIEWVPHMIRRDFITWGTVLFIAIGGLSQVAFLTMAVGGFITAPIVLFEHVRLRLLLRKVRQASGRRSPPPDHAAA